MNSVPSQEQINKRDSWKMFDRISPRYDFLNRLFSMGLDVYWRKSLKKFLPTHPNLEILDLATGTADVLIYLLRNCPHIRQSFGLDMADQMLSVGRQKIKKLNLDSKIHLRHGDAHDIPFTNNTFDCVTIAFGIRNMSDPLKVLMNMHRVLKPSGKAVVLEFSLPQNLLIRRVYLFYLSRVIPTIGGWLSKDRYAYRYLNKTVETFPAGEDFSRMMRQAGFQNVLNWPLTFGIASVYEGVK